MTRKIFCLKGVAVLAILVCTNSLYAQTVKIGVHHVPPYYESEDQKSISGIYVDLLKKIMEKADLKYEFVYYPPKRLFYNLNTGKVDLWLGPVIHKEYQTNVNISAEEIRKVIIRLYGIKGKPVPKDIEGLKGKRLLVIHGYNYGGFLEKLKDPSGNIIIDPSPNHLSGFLKLENKRGDYLLDYREPCIETLKKNPIDNIDYVDFITVPVHLHISKMTPNSEELMKKLVKTALEIEDSK